MTVEKEFIRRNMPTANCHASTVLPLDDGSVIAAWFGGSKEGNDDVDIFYSVRNEDGFQPPKQISAGANLPHWNPVLFRHNDGRISLFFKVGKKIPKWKTYRCISEDGGLTFSQPEELVPGDRSGGRGPVKNKCIRLSGGRILAPASAENRGWNCFVDISDDDGMTFRKSGIIKAGPCFPLTNKANGYSPNRIPMIQPTLWESEPGKVHMFTRTSLGRIYRSDSDDSGETWCEAYPTELPNNNSGIDAVFTPDGLLYLVSNPVGENWGERSPLTLQVSSDNGRSFTTAAILEEEKKDSEFSYPAIVYKDGFLHITYTWERLNIVYARIKIKRS